MQPINMTIHISVRSTIGFAGRRMRGRTITGPVNFPIETMVHGLRLIRYREGDASQHTVKALAFIPERDRIHIPRADKGWVNEELCWVDAPISLNGKGRDSHVLAEFLASGDDEWIAQEKS